MNRRLQSSKAATRLTLLLFSGLFLAGLLGGCGREAKQPSAQSQTPKREYPLDSLETAEVRVDGHRLTVWVMDSEGKRREGLMHVKPEELPEGKGMLFVFPDAEERSFWMRNTEVALDIAFFGPDKRLLNVERGIPFDETGVRSSGPAQYVLEVREGTFDKLGLRKGARLEIKRRSSGG